ncbi:MAG: DUF1109 family protein [Pararhodobacter sp.]|nr:DUF1109 family protein [Pararhodobacter sp.]
MKTDDLIAALAADTLPRRTAGQRLVRVLPLALGAALGAFALFWGLRPDLVAALASFAALKTVLPLVLALLAGVLALALSDPQARAPRLAAMLWLFGVCLLIAFLVAVAGAGLSGLAGALITSSLLICLTSIPLLALPLLGAALWALAAGAPAKPAANGAVAGLAAGGLATGIYSLYCDQDSVLFFLPAYAVAILIVALIGWWAGGRALAW